MEANQITKDINRTRRWCTLLMLSSTALLLAVAGRPVTASALSLHPNPLLFDFGALRGEARLVAFDSGIPEGALALEGAVAPTDLTVILEVTLDAESAPIGPLGVFATHLPAGTLVNPTGAGVLPGAGADISGVTRTTSPGVGESVLFAFAGGSLEGGQAADPIFVSFPALEIGDLFGVTIAAPREPWQQFGRRDAVSGYLVPEPGAITLFAMGCALVARTSARRTS